jgi:ABC-type sugar transport system ATPase subunit
MPHGPTGSPAGPPALEVHDLLRDFGSFRALSNVDLRIGVGTIHALVGQNGAGKSTLIGILAGRVRPSGGRVALLGNEIAYGNPRAIAQAGLATIYQELTIVASLSAVANVFLGHPMAKVGWLARGAMQRAFAELAKTLGVTINPEARAGALSVADQQMLEIMRALVLEPRVMLLDEPTASLSLAERESLLRVMRRLREQGMTLLLVSHNLDEVLSISDEITVLRDGEVVASGECGQWDKPRLVRAMLGDVSDGELAEVAAAGIGDIGAAPPCACGIPRPASGEDALRVDSLHVPPYLHHVSLRVGQGEIVGIAGLVGSGRTTLVRAIAGLEPASRGTITLRGVSRPMPRTPRGARRLGIGLLPEDRKFQGLVLQLTAAENVALGWAATLRPASPRRFRREAADAARAAGFDVRRLDEPIAHFSGGNQQKILLARAASTSLSVLLADEPTRGIDIHAKSETLASLRAMADRGLGVAVISSDLEELISLSDRIYVLTGGTCVTELARGRSDWSVACILAAAYGTSITPSANVGASN